MLGGENTSIDPRDLLPFPGEATDNSDRRISRKTGKILIQLEREGKIPEAFLGQLSNFLKEAKKQS
jgi:hypothetical protein